MDMLKILVVYAHPPRQAQVPVAVEAGATVRQAIEKSGILGRFPEIDLEQNKVGLWGRLTSLDAALEDGARIEIYRPITADPKTVPRRNQKAEG